MTATLDDEIVDLRRAIAELQRTLNEALAERDESLQRETATAEVLQVINSSPGHLTPVFDTMLEKAMRLCTAEFGEFFITDGERLRAVAVRGVPAAFAEFRHRNPAPPIPGSIAARILSGEPVIHVVDVKNDDLYRRGDLHRRALVDLGGARTFLSVALIKDRAVLGSINIYRQEVRPFSDKQISLLQNFAAQAVIAMENARLLTETREALAQQTATAEVLQVINSSPGDLAPVFDAMLEKAMRLCGAAFGFMTVIDGERSRTVAARGVPAAYAAFRERNPTPANAPIASRVRKGEPFIHTVDLKAERFYGEGDPQRRAIVDLGGARTLLAVPLMRDQAVLGAIQVYRTEVRSFSDKQIALLQNFAAQAVIAMESARLLTETREALEQQTATSEVLQVINSSPGDLAPVFDAILDKAHDLCGAAYGGLMTFDGEAFRVVAAHGDPDFVNYWQQGSIVPPEDSPLGRVMHGAAIVHISDAIAEDTYRTVPALTRLVDLGGVRTCVIVPLRKDDVLLGVITA